jgi:hypothetical protein
VEVTPVKQVVVAAGHMIDGHDRAVPRFPHEAETRVARWIDDALGRLDVGPGTVVCCQGASGTDLLVAEASLRRAAAVRLLLAFEPEAFLARSVAPSGGDWAARFRAVLNASEVLIRDSAGDEQDADPYEATNRSLLRVASQLAAERSVPLRAVVLCDGSDPDGAGGTSHFLQLLQEAGITGDVTSPGAAWRSPNVPFWERQWSPGPKRLLSLDGGGLRGLIALEVLARIEELLGAGDPSFVLSDYFDYVAGTSTGAIIAAALSIGNRVDDVRRLYLEMAPEVFRRGRLATRLRSLYNEEALSSVLRRHLGADTTLGSDTLRTLLLVVLHRIDTDSIWPLSNHTRALYNDRRSCSMGSNLDLPLWQVVRGSAAAPVFFAPEAISVGGRDALFEDGAVTTFNNPAPLLFEMATSPRYGLEWADGAEQLLLVSVGTGHAAALHEDLSSDDVNLRFQARHPLRVFLNASAVENDRLCRVLGDVRHGDAIDSEFDPPGVVMRSCARPLFSYVRYDADLSAGGLERNGLGHIDPAVVARIDSISAMDHLTEVGRAASRAVRREHFDGFELQSR